MREVLRPQAIAYGQHSKIWLRGVVRRLLPADKLIRLKNAKMGGYKINDPKALHFLTMVVVKWIDVFTRDIYRQIVFDSLRYCQKNKGLEVYGYVIMSNHLHLIAKTETGNLSDVLRDFKAHTGREIIKSIHEGPESRRDWMLNLFEMEAKKRKKNKVYQVWTHDNHPEELYSNKFIWQKLNYIHLNPVRNRIVVEPWDYRYSSARNYAGMEAVLDIIPLSPELRTFN